MKTFLVSPKEAAPGFGQRISDKNPGIGRPWLTIWLALAIALVATPSHAQFLYVTNQAEAIVSGYQMDPCSGELTFIASSPFAAGNNPMSVAVEPSGTFAYVANRGDNNVSGYTVNPRTGALKPIAGSPFAVETQPVSLAVDRNGRFAYVVTRPPPSHPEQKSNISGYTINQTTGELTAIVGSSFEITGTGNSVAIDPNGKFAYVTAFDGGAGNIYGYKIDPSTGALNLAFIPISLPLGPSPSSVAVDPTGKFAYVTNQGSGLFFGNSILGFAINETSGDLSFVSSSLAGVDPRFVVVDPSGKFVYVTNESSDNVSGYAIDPATGALTPIAGSPFPAGRSPRSVAVDPSGKFAYVANSKSDTISGYKIDTSTGALTAMAGSPFTTSGEPSSVAIARP